MSTPATAGSAAERLEGASFRARSGELLMVRHCRGLDEFGACVELQKQTWGYLEDETTPRKAFLLAQELGGQVIGAFTEDRRMVAFAMAMAAIEKPSPSVRQATDPQPPRVYLHSHMLAVRPEYRDSGLGRRLKLVQREDALERGITRMTWTFDPLAAKNAYLNVHRLGAIARRYSPNFYGVSSSQLQCGLPSDRLHADWFLRSQRVTARLAGQDDACSGGYAEDMKSTADHAKQTGGPIEQRILLPGWLQPGAGAEISDDQKYEKMLAVQSEIRTQFLQSFERGLAVVGFSRDAQGTGIYELAAWHPPPAS